MKLRNKKTGEIVKFAGTYINREGRVFLELEDEIGVFKKEINSLTGLNEEWEDYEEPKEHYFITEYGEVFSLNEYEGLNNVANPEDYRAIGNYFETREEAEKAVEKLKAWKRLKDRGFRFYHCEELGGKYIIYCNWGYKLPPLGFLVKNDIDLLFGGEE